MYSKAAMGVSWVCSIPPADVNLCNIESIKLLTFILKIDKLKVASGGM